MCQHALSRPPTITTVLLAPVSTEIAFWHGMDRLVGDVVLPPWPGPHPAVLLVRPPTGSGRACTWQQRLAAAGIASLAFDPPGNGRSTGDWRRQSLGDRASEVLAGREVLAAHPDVAADAIALLVVGESGWAGIRAEAFARTFAGLVLLSVPVLEPVAVEQYRLGRRLERHGFPGEDIGVAVAVLRERFRRLADGADADQVLQAEAACRTAPWYGLMPQLTAQDVPLFTRLVGVDPAPELTAVGCPVLSLNGASDLSVPVQRNVEAVLGALRSAGHSDHACVVVPDADHELRGTDGEVAPGVHELVVTWLDRRLARARRGSGAPSVAAAAPVPAAAPAAAPTASPAAAFPPPPPVLVPAGGRANGTANGTANGYAPAADGYGRAANGHPDDDPLTSPSYTIGRDGYVPPADDLFAPRQETRGAPYVGDSGWQGPPASSGPASSVTSSASPAAPQWAGGDRQEFRVPVTEVMPVLGRQPQRPAF